MGTPPAENPIRQDHAPDSPQDCRKWGGWAGGEWGDV